MSNVAAPSTIRIVLLNGGSDSAWMIEKDGWNGMALMAPRTRYKELRARPELKESGVYFLVGGATESGVLTSRVYIGETDDLPGRLDNHLKNKEFWDRAIVFTSSTRSLNNAHWRHIEGRLIALAKAAKRTELDNVNAGTTPHLSVADTAAAETFLREMLLMCSVLGVPIFQKPAEQPSSSATLQLHGIDPQPTGSRTPDGFLVYAGSLARSKVGVLKRPTVNRRNALMESGILVSDGTQLRLTEDHLFSNPSQAASVMLGRAANGLIEWRTAGGTTLKQLQEEASG